MGMHIAILPDADRGMPRWGVAPIHVQGARIGIRASLAVAQPKARQRHAESAACPSQARFRVRSPPKCPGHSRIGIGRAVSGPQDRLPAVLGSTAPETSRSMDPNLGIGVHRPGGSTPRTCANAALEARYWPASPADATFQTRRSCSPSSREESNDGTHETSPAQLWRRRMGPEPGEGLPRIPRPACTRSSGERTGAGSQGRCNTATGGRRRRRRTSSLRDSPGRS